MSDIVLWVTMAGCLALMIGLFVRVQAVSDQVRAVADRLAALDHDLRG